MSGRGFGALAVVLAAVAPLHGQAPTAASGGPGVEAAGWLAGCWVARSGEVRTDEVWMAPEGGLMVGMGRSVRGGQARGWEHMVLAVREGTLTYSAYPSGQALTHFALATAGPDRLRFENPGHDFPRALEYLRAGADSMNVRVFGDVEDPDPAFTLRLGRERCSP